MTDPLYLKKVTERPRGRGPAESGRRTRSGVRQEIFLDVVAVGLEQHASAAQLADLLLGPLDHAVALAALGVHHLAGGRHFEALLGARFGLQLGHLALLLAGNTIAPVGRKSG